MRALESELASLRANPPRPCGTGCFGWTWISDGAYDGVYEGGWIGGKTDETDASIKYAKVYLTARACGEASTHTTRACGTTESFTATAT